MKVLDAGADPSIVDAKGRSALWSVVCSAVDVWFAMFRVLLNYDLPINDPDRDGQLLLSRIVSRDDTPAEVIQLLLERGADLSLRGTGCRKTLLEVAREGVSHTSILVINEFMAKDSQ